MKRSCMIFLLILSLSAAAGNREMPRFTYGVEWSYIAFIHHGLHNNFYAPDGYRVDENSSDIRSGLNAEASIHAGYNISDRWNLSVFLGYMGISGMHNAIPVSIRGTHYFRKNTNGDRWFAFTDLGSGVCLTSRPQEILTAKIGAGYRIPLSRRVKLDLKADARIIYTHPEVIYYNDTIHWDSVNRNNAYLSGISVGIGLTF